MRSIEELQVAVQRGAMALDYWNENWRRLVDPEALDMESGAYRPGEYCGCVLSQIDYRKETGIPGRYRNGLRLVSALHAGEELAEFEISHGFDANDEEEYEILTELWQKEILDPVY